jgi:hypothetical protein
MRAYPVDAQWATRTRLSSTGRRALCAIHRNGPYSSPFYLSDYLSARTDDGNMVFSYPQSIGGDCRNGEKQNSRWLSSIGLFCHRCFLGSVARSAARRSRVSAFSLRMRSCPWSRNSVSIVERPERSVLGLGKWKSSHVSRSQSFLIQMQNSPSSHTLSSGIIQPHGRSRAYPVDAQWATRTRLSSTGRRALCAVHRNGPYSSPFYLSDYLSARTDDGNMVFSYPQSIGGDCRNGEKQNSRWLSSIGRQPADKIGVARKLSRTISCSIPQSINT